MGKLRRLALLSAALALIAVGCNDSDDNSDAADSGSPASGTQSSGDESNGKPEIIFVAAAPTSEPFASVSANGLEQAGEDFNLDVQWRGPNEPNPSDPSIGLRLIKRAIAAKPDGLIIADTFPKQFNPTIKSAADSGIPVILASYGKDEVDKVGALAYIGNDEYGSGVLAGEQMTKLGAKHPLLVTTARGLPDLDARADGFKEGFEGEDVTTLELPLNDLGNTTKVRNEIEVEIGKDDSIDSLWVIGTGIGAPVLAARDRLGDRANDMKWGQLGLDEPTIQALQDKKYDFSTDQQQYLIGYLPAMYLAMNLRYGFTPVDDFIPTGPSLVTPDEAEKLAELNAEKIR